MGRPDTGKIPSQFDSIKQEIGSVYFQSMCGIYLQLINRRTGPAANCLNAGIYFSNARIADYRDHHPNRAENNDRRSAYKICGRRVCLRK